MPRHRKQRVLMHRALRRADNPARRARLTAAVDTATAVLDNSRRDDLDTADTAPLATLRSGSRHRRTGTRAVRPQASWSASTRVLGNLGGVLRSGARGLLMTPWFAAASFFVIVASLWIYSPHAHLQFPGNSAIRLQHCHSHCPPAESEGGSGSLATSGKGRLTEPRRSQAGGVPAVRNSTTVSGLTFSYYSLPTRQGTFMIRISVFGKAAIRDWRLAFVLPGDKIRRVSEANWQRTSRDSGTASSDGQQGLWPGDAPGDGGQFGGDHHQYGFTFYVSGTGPPVGPARCRYDGLSCTFVNGRPGPDWG